MNELSILDSLFDDVMSNAGASAVYAATPRVDVMENEDSYVLEMDLPGRCEKDVNIELNHDNLMISSKKEESKEDKKDKKAEKFILRERRNSSFERNFTLPSDVDSDSITANFKNGVLTVLMQKKAVAAPKKIMIEAC